ncbi:MAG: TolB-like translocation protein, partial [Planctomycetota bacterium]
MVGRTITLVVLGLVVCVWCANPACGEREEEEASRLERLADLERELELARESGNDQEVEEIRELMTRLTDHLRESDKLEMPHAEAIEIDIDGLSDTEVSSASCGFALVYSPTADSQLAVMEPAGVLVGSVEAGGMITVVVPIAPVDGPFQIRVNAGLWEGLGAQVSFSLSESGASWHRLGDAPTLLEVTGEPQGGPVVLVVKMKSGKSRAAIRLANLELATKGETYRLRLPVPTLSIDRFPRPELPAMRASIERALIEWDWRMQDGIGTARESRTYDQAVEETLGRGDALIAHLVGSGISPGEDALRWSALRGQWRRLRASSGTSDAAWENLWREVHLLRRKIVLQNHLAGTGPTAFVKCTPTNNSIMQQQYIGRFARPAGGIFVLEQPGKSMRCRALTEGRLPGGAYQHLDVSYDGRRILLAFCELDKPPHDSYQGNPGHCFNIYEIRADGSGLRPVIVSAHDDFAPRYLPDGN